MFTEKQCLTIKAMNLALAFGAGFVTMAAFTLIEDGPTRVILGVLMWLGLWGWFTWWRIRAIQKREAAKVDVREQTEDGQAMGEAQQEEEGLGKA